MYFFTVIVYISFFLSSCPEVTKRILLSFNYHYFDSDLSDMDDFVNLTVMDRLDIELRVLSEYLNNHINLDNTLYFSHPNQLVDQLHSYPAFDQQYTDDPFESYDPFESSRYVITESIEDPRSINLQAFEQNSTLPYNVVSIGDVIMAVGAENSIFTTNLIQTLRDLSIETTEEVANNGNVTTTLRIEAEVANYLMQSISGGGYTSSDSGNSLFSNLAEARLLVQQQYEEDIRNIRTESVGFSSEVYNTISPVHNGDVITLIDVRPVVDETELNAFAEQLRERNQMVMD